MGTVSAAGDFNRAGNTVAAAGCPNHLHISAPVFLIEINDEEAASFILQERINPEYMTTTQVRFNRSRIIGTVLRMGAICAFSLWLQANAVFPLISACRTVAGASVFAFPAAGKHIGSALEQREEKRDSVRKRASFRYRNIHGHIVM